MSIYYGGAALVDCIAVFTAATTDETNASERPSDPIPDVDNKENQGGRMHCMLIKTCRMPINQLQQSYVIICDVRASVTGRSHRYL